MSRRIGLTWMPVLDIPDWREAESGGSIDDLLITMAKIEPILHKLDERLKGSDARFFLSGLQQFFHGSNLLTAAVHDDLRFAADCLLRVLSMGADNEHYSRSKTAGAAQRLESFRQKAGIGHQLPELIADEHIGLYFTQLMGSLTIMVDHAPSNIGLNVHLLRLMIALLDYGRAITLGRGEYPALSPQLNETLRGFLSDALSIGLKVHLPSALDLRLTSDMKLFCSDAWERLLRKERQR